MKISLAVTLFCILACACDTIAPAPNRAAIPDHQLNKTTYSGHSDLFEVEAWVDNPTPDQNRRVNAHGSLIKNGVRLGGMAMVAVWPDPGQEYGVPNCSVQVIYGSGVCLIVAADFSPGEYVPITVTFHYAGEIFSGHTGFTPQK